MKSMDYESLSDPNWTTQLQRVNEAVRRIVERSQLIAQGRTVPDDDSLAIGTGKRLPMAVLFLDISSFSQRPSETQAEQGQVLAVLNLFFTQMMLIAEDYGGQIEKNTGDGLMAYFPDNFGTPPEAGCKRAVAAALTMHYSNSYAISPVLAQSGISPINFRIGIDYGEVTIARIGAPKRFNSYAAVGTRANVASKMLAVAEPSEILIGDSVYWQLPSWWQRYCQLKTVDTGWYYRATGAPYPFFSYTGRWTGPR